MTVARPAPLAAPARSGITLGQVSPGRITLGQITATFVPFALLLSAALLGAEVAQNLVLTRVHTSSWVALGFFTVAFCLYIWPGDSPRRRSWWLLVWTFALLAYLVHFGYSFFGPHHGSLRDIWQSQRPLIATSNFLVTLWWTVDVILAWLHRENWRGIARTLIHLLAFVTFFTSSLVLFGGVVRVFGALMTAAVLIALGARLVRRFHHSPPVPAAAAPV
jgi:hypothetical protein